ncbi:Alpha-globin transcription factor CP2 [Eumeta japonica]|uniref:Alpha-globin transcription factor CP2 n=1 Tax=Eumeta variegata TaxID=151549 RepID=A0A4C1W0G6_EUMVA|nr:Alpha-globin transcription factor CP2 [Eumeta japonica]
MVVEHQPRLSAAAVLEFAAREAREGRRLTEFGAQAFASVTYNTYDFYHLMNFINSLLYIFLFQTERPELLIFTAENMRMKQKVYGDGDAVCRRRSFRFISYILDKSQGLLADYWPKSFTIVVPSSPAAVGDMGGSGSSSSSHVSPVWQVNDLDLDLPGELSMKHVDSEALLSLPTLAVFKQEAPSPTGGAAISPGHNRHWQRRHDDRQRCGVGTVTRTDGHLLQKSVSLQIPIVGHGHEAVLDQRRHRFRKFQKLSMEKLKGGIFDGSQIRQLMKDTDFIKVMTVPESDACKSFVLVVENFLGNYSEEQGKRFHQDLKVMEERYQGRWDCHMMADYCWSLKEIITRMAVDGEQRVDAMCQQLTAHPAPIVTSHVGSSESMQCQSTMGAGTLMTLNGYHSPPTAMDNKGGGLLICSPASSLDGLLSTPPAAPCPEPCFKDDMRFQYVLAAATSIATKTNEETLTYLNQGQPYEIKLKKLGDLSQYKGKILKSVIKICFHERRLQYMEREQMAQWHQERPGERIVEVDIPLSYGVTRVVQAPAPHLLNAVEVFWDPTKDVGVYVKVRPLPDLDADADDHLVV